MRTILMLIIAALPAAAATTPKADAPDPLGKGYMGVIANTEDAPPSVSTVEDNSPAAQAGIRNGDKLLRVGPLNKPGSFTEVRTWIKSQRPGTRVEMTLGRGDEQIKTVIVLGVRPAHLDGGGIEVIPP